MKCSNPNCDGQVLTESLGEGKVRVTCQKCGLSEVKDQEGRQLLTDDKGSMGGSPRNPLLG